MVNRINIWSDGQSVQGQVAGNPVEIIKMIHSVIKKISESRDGNYDDVLRILSDYNKLEEVCEFTANQIQNGIMSPESGLAFADSLMNVVLNKDKRQNNEKN